MALTGAVGSDAYRIFSTIAVVIYTAAAFLLSG